MILYCLFKFLLCFPKYSDCYGLPFSYELKQTVPSKLKRQCPWFFQRNVEIRFIFTVGEVLYNYWIVERFFVWVWSGEDMINPLWLCDTGIPCILLQIAAEDWQNHFFSSFFRPWSQGRLSQIWHTSFDIACVL